MSKSKPVILPFVVIGRAELMAAQSSPAEASAVVGTIASELGQLCAMIAPTAEVLAPLSVDLARIIFERALEVRVQLEAVRAEDDADHDRVKEMAESAVAHAKARADGAEG